MKVIIVGGVAGGASCAARLRRLDEKAEILLAEGLIQVNYSLTSKTSSCFLLIPIALKNITSK